MHGDRQVLLVAGNRIVRLGKSSLPERNKPVDSSSIKSRVAQICCDNERYSGSLGTQL